MLRKSLLLIILSLAFTGFATAAFSAEHSAANAPFKICPLPLGSAIPDLPTRDLDGKPFDLTAALAEKPTILIYFRGGW